MHERMATKILMVFNLGWLDFKNKRRGRKETRGREREGEREGKRRKKRKCDLKNQINLNLPFPKNRTDWMRERQNPQVKRFLPLLTWVRAMVTVSQFPNTPTEINT